MLPLGQVLLASVQTEVTDNVVVALREELLSQVIVRGVRGVVIDISGVQVFDSYLSRVVTETAQALRLLSARTVVAGMSPAVAVTMVEMGLDLPGVATARSLAHALRILAPDALSPPPSAGPAPQDAV